MESTLLNVMVLRFVLKVIPFAEKCPRKPETCIKRRITGTVILVRSTIPTKKESNNKKSGTISPEFVGY